MALTFTVDNTGDTDGQLCTVAASDCSLRSAVTLSNNTAGTDDIDFDPTVFNGGAGSTITTGGTPSDITITDTVQITGGNCGTSTAPKPCVGIAKSGGSSTLTVNASNTTISGIAFTGASSSAAILSFALTSPTVTGSWFGVGLNGTTISANQTGVDFLGGGSGGVIGGDSPVERNVFANNSDEAIALAGNGGGHTVQGNYIGTLPDGSAVPSPGGSGVLIVGSNDNDTIGGDATTAGQCNGACNLIVKQSGAAIVTAAGPSGPTGTAIRGNFIGLGLNGTADQGNGGSGISLDSSGGTTIGGSAATQRNYIAGNDGGGIASQQGNGINVVNNFIGLNAAGTSSIANTTAAPAGGSGIMYFGDGGSVVNNHLGANGVVVGEGTLGVGGTTIQGNLIGVGAGDQAFDINGEPGLHIFGSHMVIGGSTTGQGNTIGNVMTASDPALLMEGSVDANVIKGNFIGTSSDGTPEPNAGTGIQMGVSNGVTNNTVGGLASADQNVISNSGKDAIYQPQAGGGNRYLGNLGRNNGAGPNDLFIDLNNDGPGNPTSWSNNGILAPTNLSLTGTGMSGAAGSAVAGATVIVYTTYTKRGDLRKALGNTVVNGNGSWSLSFGGALPAGQCVTANQTDTSGNSSELATPIAVGGGGSCALPPPASITSGPANGSTISVDNASFAFSSSETGVSFECKVDSGSFGACTSPFSLSGLTGGSHTFQVRALKTPVNPALGMEIGGVAGRTFSVSLPVPPTPAPSSTPAPTMKKCKKAKKKRSASTRTAGSAAAKKCKKKKK